MPRPELETLRQLVDSAGNQVLIEGPRRIGKTMLVKQAVHPDLLLIIDLKGQNSEDRVTNAFRRALEAFTGEAISDETVRQKASGFRMASPIGYLRTTKQVDTDPNDLEALFRRIGDLARQHAPQPLIVFIDEVQVLAEFEGGLEIADRIRGQIQHHSEATYVFAGSNGHLLLHLDQLSKGAFYKQLERLRLGPIARPDFAAWISKRLADYDAGIEPPALEIVFDFSRDVPGDVQRVLAAAYRQVKSDSQGGTVIDMETVALCIDRLLDVLAPSLEIQVGSMTESQRRLALGLAAMVHNGRNFTKTGREMRYVSGIDNSGTVGSACEALLREGTLSHWNNRHQVDDPFVEAFLIRLYPYDYEAAVERLQKLPSPGGTIR